jgi:hypothetical protein
VGGGSGAKRGIERRSATSTTGTVAWRSMSSSRRPAVTATSGRIAPTHIQNERTDEPCFPDQPRGHHDGDDPAGTEGRIEVAHPVSAAMEHVLRVLDTEHAEGADRDSLGAEQGHEHGRLRVTSHGRERAAESGPVSVAVLRSRNGRRDVSERQHECGSERAAGRRERKHRRL